jgi:hypothetical protein
VDVAAGVQVAPVDDQASDGASLPDLERLDAEIAGKGAVDPGADRFGRDLGVAAGTGRAG